MDEQHMHKREVTHIAQRGEGEKEDWIFLETSEIL